MLNATFIPHQPLPSPPEETKARWRWGHRYAQEIEWWKQVPPFLYCECSGREVPGGMAEGGCPVRRDLAAALPSPS